MINVVSHYYPASLEEALDLMASRELTPIAGGTDLVPQMRDGEPRALIDVARLGLNYVRVAEGALEIGPCVTHSNLCCDRDVVRFLPLLSSAAGVIGAVQIRNRGTIGGNVVNASPSADTVPALLNYDAEVVLVSKAGRRRMKLEEFVKRPYVTDRKPGELLTSIVCKTSGATAVVAARAAGEVPSGAPGGAPSAALGLEVGTCFLKLGRRNAMNISRMSLAVLLTVGADRRIGSARVSAGAVFPVAKRMLEVERLLAGQIVSTKLFQEAGLLATELLVKETGIRWSTPYKMPVLKGLLERALHRAAENSGVTAE
ncbi:MAG: xanthine dehydrogenase family protein subunit M [Candidatus Eisenbacteria bacterium]|nr:xanthine dehydrogenase family protein subunit M [Candidatus Eisenbacteria bacterium]